MAVATFSNIKISGLACAVPKQIGMIREFDDRYDVEKFISSTGVERRRLVRREQSCTDLCYEAANALISRKGYAKDSFDSVILVTQTSDYQMPASSHILHLRLGLSKNCMAFDINLGCSGFVYGINLAACLIQAGTAHRVLLCCGEANAPVKHEVDPESYLLFGDAGSAVILEETPRGGVESIHTLLKADGSGFQDIISVSYAARNDAKNGDVLDYKQFGTKMDGASVFEFAIREVPRAFKEFFAEFGGSIDTYDYCVFHQANLFMLEHIRKKIKLAKEKMPVSIDRYGNTSSASIPLTIADLCQRESVADRIRFITCGFGVGLSWGIACFSMNRADILPILETDEYFREAYRGGSLIPESGS